MASKDSLSISFKAKYNFICIRLKLPHAYRYRLEQYCGKRERGKFANQICLLRLASIKSTAESCRTDYQVECVAYPESAVSLSRFLRSFATF